jgi:hypothetical protein
MDVNKVARAIEGDAEHVLPGLRESLAQAKAGTFSRVHTPEQIVARRRGRPMGSKQEVTKGGRQNPVGCRCDGSPPGKWRRMANTHQRYVACLSSFEWRDFYRIRRPMKPYCRTERPPRQSSGFDARKRSNCPKICAVVSAYFPSCYSENSHQTATECSKKALNVEQIRARAR